MSNINPAFILEGAKLLNRGAEALIYEKENQIIKVRQRKHYRIREIDRPLIKYRTRGEARILQRLQSNNVPAPRLIEVDEKKGILVMQKISGQKLRDVLDDSNYLFFMKKVGEIIAKMHSLNIIHNDLTTSNFIVNDKEVFVIDFGLSYISPKVEDKAVDIHLLKRALESKHSAFWKEAFDVFIKSYEENYSDCELVFSRLKEVEKRGRYKRKKKNRDSN